MSLRTDFLRFCETWPELGAFAGARTQNDALSSLAPDAARARTAALASLAGKASGFDAELLTQASGFFQRLLDCGQWRKNPDVLAEWSALLLRQALLAQTDLEEAERLAGWLHSFPRALRGALGERTSPDPRALELALDACLGFRSQLDAVADLVPPASLQVALLALGQHHEALRQLRPGEPTPFLGQATDLGEFLRARGIDAPPAELIELFDCEIQDQQRALASMPEIEGPLSPTFPPDVIRDALRLELEVAAEVWRSAGLPGCDVRFEVLPVPEGLDGAIPHAAVFTPRALQPREPGLVVLNPESTLALDGARRLLLAVHEGGPGHGLQAARANSAEAPWRAVDLCPIPGFGAGVFAGETMEGWAHFAEARYAAFFPDDLTLQRTVRREALWRAVRGRADLGLASGELSEAAASTLFATAAGLSERDARAEVDDLRLNPTYGLGYTLGKVRLQALFHSWQGTEAERIEKLLAHGLAPLGAIARAIDAGR